MEERGVCPEVRLDAEYLVTRARGANNPYFGVQVKYLNRKEILVNNF